MKKNSFEAEVEALRIVLGALESLDEDQQNFVVRSVVDRLKLQVDVGTVNRQFTRQGADPLVGQSDKLPSPKDFLGQKIPSSVVERMTCLGFYLAHFRDTPHFKTLDLTKLNMEAAGQKISNPALFARNAVSQNQYFAAAGGGKKQITAHGEAIVKALPDREKVKEIIEAYRSRKK